MTIIPRSKNGGWIVVSSSGALVEFDVGAAQSLSALYQLVNGINAAIGSRENFQISMMGLSTYTAVFNQFNGALVARAEDYLAEHDKFAKLFETLLESSISAGRRSRQAERYSH